MLEPAPTSPIAPGLARGVLAEVVPATATKPGYLVLTVPNTDYRLHLLPTADVSSAPGSRLVGTVRVEARRVDPVSGGGRYVEPVYGSPRRIQGSIVAVHPETNAITVNAGVPVVCRLTAPDRSGQRQRAEDFAVGDFVTMGVLPGATFSSA